MERLISLLVLIFVLFIHACTPSLEQEFVTSDISHFWEAYDQIVATTDTVEQERLLNELYLQKGSPGLESIMEVRNYTPAEYLQAIRNYPQFWESIRTQTTTVGQHLPIIENHLQMLKEAYPELQPAPVYFTIGAFRTGGTAHEGKVLIGTELSLANQETVIDELPEWRQPFYRTSVPVDDLPLLCTHEYIHTQQSELQNDLLSRCLYEGVAEYVSCLATNLPSSSPAIAFGQANQERVIEKFVVDLFSRSNDYNWMWGENTNELQVRDLGYYIGYEICERYYQNAEDKPAAIRELIQLDFTQQDKIEQLVDNSGLLPKPIAVLREEYEQSRPTVIEVENFANGSTDVDPSLKTITVRFSEPLNGYHAGIDFGPLGEEYCPKMDPLGRSWGETGETYTVAVSLEAGQQYQFAISSSFRTEKGTRLQPYVIKFQTR